MATLQSKSVREELKKKYKKTLEQEGGILKFFGIIFLGVLLSAALAIYLVPTSFMILFAAKLILAAIGGHYALTWFGGPFDLSVFGTPFFLAVYAIIAFASTFTYFKWLAERPDDLNNE